MLNINRLRNRANVINIDGLLMKNGDVSGGMVASCAWRGGEPWHQCASSDSRWAEDDAAWGIETVVAGFLRGNFCSARVDVKIRQHR